LHTARPTESWSNAHARPEDTWSPRRSRWLMVIRTARRYGARAGRFARRVSGILARRVISRHVRFRFVIRANENATAKPRRYRHPRVPLEHINLIFAAVARSLYIDQWYTDVSVFKKFTQNNKFCSSLKTRVVYITPKIAKTELSNSLAIYFAPVVINNWCKIYC